MVPSDFSFFFSFLFLFIDKRTGGVYNFIWGLITKGKYAHLVNQEGRFSLNWKIAVEQYFKHLSWSSQHKHEAKVFNKRDAGNMLQCALLTHYAGEGAYEYVEARRHNERNEVIECEFQMPPRIFKALVEKSNGRKEAGISRDDPSLKVMFLENGRCLHHITFCCCHIYYNQCCDIHTRTIGFDTHSHKPQVTRHYTQDSRSM